MASPRRSPPDRSRPAADAKAEPAAGVFPDPRQFTDPTQPFLLPLLLLLVTRVIAAILSKAPAEDAFITFRYARNFASGHGLVYNPDERVMGFTSPLWTLWNAAGVALFHDPIVWARVTAGVADAVTLLVLVHLLLRHTSRTSAWAFALFFAAWPYFAFVSASGMEMTVLVALIALSAACAANGSLATGPVLAALALTRPEGFAAAIVLAFGARWRDRGVALVLIAAAVAALTAYYGSPIPNSVTSKAAVYGLSGPWAARSWWAWMSPIVFGRFSNAGDTSMLLWFTLLWSPAMVYGARTLWSLRSTALARATLAMIGIWLAYSLAGAAYFWWYLAVPLAGIVLLSAIGLPQMVRGRVVYVCLALFLASVWSAAPNLYIGRAQLEQVAFAGAARELAARCTPGDHVFLEPIGFVGYYAPVIVIDEIGIVTPRIAARRRQGPGWYTDVVANERPEWLLVRSSVLNTGVGFAGAGAPFRNTAERDSVRARYDLVKRTGAEDDAGAILLLRRK